MAPLKLLCISADSRQREALAKHLSDRRTDFDVDAPDFFDPILSRVRAGEYGAAVCSVEAPEDLAAVIRIRKAKPDLALVAVSAPDPSLKALARQMGATEVVERAQDPAETASLIFRVLETRTLAAQSSSGTPATEIRDFPSRQRELVARAMGVLASCNDQPFVVLHVDDDEYEEFVVRRLLIRAGLPSFVRSLRSAEEAVAYLSGEGDYADRTKHPLPSLVISDLNLGPGMDGLGLLTWIRGRAELRSLGFVLVTSSEAEEHVRRAAEAGANLYVVKSMRMDSIAEILQASYASWLDLHPANRAT